MLPSSGSSSSQPRSHVQVNIYGTTVDALRSRGVDLERLLSSLGCRCVVMDVPEVSCEATDLVSVTSFQGCEDWVNDSSNKCDHVSTMKENSLENQRPLCEETQEHELQNCPIISELSADSFVDSKLFLDLKEDPASSSFSVKPCLIYDDSKLHRFYMNGDSTTDQKMELHEVEIQPNSDLPSGRIQRRRAPPLSFSPRDSPDTKRKRKMKLVSRIRRTSRSDREFQCMISGCGKVLHFKQSCRRQGLDHVRSHFPRKTRRCKICEYSGNTNASVYNHHTSCHSELPYPGPLATETKEDLEHLQLLFNQAFPEIPGIESYISVIS